MKAISEMDYFELQEAIDDATIELDALVEGTEEHYENSLYLSELLNEQANRI